MVQLSPAASPARSASPFSSGAALLPACERPLCSRVRRALQSTGHQPLRSVRVCEDDGVIRLQGSVPTWFLKQVAQAAALTVPDVELLRNELVVR